MRRLILVLFFSFFTFMAFAQDQLQLAMQYYNSGEYDKSAVIFEKLYKQRKAKYYFDYYIQSLIKSNQYDKAEKAINKQIRKNPGRKSFMVDLGYVMQLKGEEEKADKIFKEVIKKLPSDRSQIYEVARTFMNYKLYQWAEKTYLRGRELTGYGFYPELASVYSLERNNAKMVEAYLDWLQSSPGQLTTIERIFSSYLKHDINNEFYNILLPAVLKRVQKTSAKVYTELLIWLYEYKGNLDMALVYAKALDKRYNENGIRVFTVGKLAMQNDNLQVAREAFSYVVSLGESSPYYYSARKAILDVWYRQVVTGKITDEKEIEQLANKYAQLLNEVGYLPDSYNIVVNLANIEAFYLDKPEVALKYLNQVLNRGNIDSKQKGILLMEKARVMLSIDKPWDAILLYSQAYDMNKTNEIGDRAKLYRAMVYYFMGDFSWAKSQFDILKGSTSKLIANDALEKSVLLDEFSQDSTMSKNLALYAKAEFYRFVSKPDSAIKIIDTLLHRSVALADYALFLKYKIDYDMGNYKEAAEDLEKIVKNYNQSLLIDRAVFYLAKLYEEKLNNRELALKYYKEILFDYKGSIFTQEAREHYRNLAGEK